MAMTKPWEDKSPDGKKVKRRKILGMYWAPTSVSLWINFCKIINLCTTKRFQDTPCQMVCNTLIPASLISQTTVILTSTPPPPPSSNRDLLKSQILREDIWEKLSQGSDRLKDDHHHSQLHERWEGKGGGWPSWSDRWRGRWSGDMAIMSTSWGYPW